MKEEFEAYLGPSQTCTMECFAPVINIFAKSSIIDLWQCPKYTSGNGANVLLISNNFSNFLELKFLIMIYSSVIWSPYVSICIDLFVKFSLDVTAFQNLYLVGLHLGEGIQKQQSSLFLIWGFKKQQLLCKKSVFKNF